LHINPEHIRKKIFTLSSRQDFEETALQIFRLQAAHNKVYQQYISLLGMSPSAVNKVEDIPFLPVRFFKSHTVTITPEEYDMVFTSSGTTGSEPSRHYVRDVFLYEESFVRSFRYFYGPVSDYCILALLPSYLERSGSSLIYMMKKLIELSGCPQSGFYLYDHASLYKTLTSLPQSVKKVLLFGVSFALLDFAEHYDIPEMNLIVMETGGMKGRRKEIIREELHTRLKEKLHVPVIHSEYGMTELLSQAYSSGEGIFSTPPWMRILIRDPYDPFFIMDTGHTGGIDVIDMANIYSCAFIETQDLGILYPDNTFTVTGRFDNSEMRGCNLMVQEI